MTQLNKAIIGAIRVVMECESSREKILTVSKVTELIHCMLGPFTRFLCLLSFRAPKIVFSIANEEYW